MSDISQSAINLIVTEEVGSRALYEKRYTHIEVPTDSSGGTIGIGYDIGMEPGNSKHLHDDWDAYLPPTTVAELEVLLGRRGGSARQAVARYSLNNRVTVPWDVAMRQFTDMALPKWIGLCRSHLPNWDALTPDCKGALVSLAYNRGPSFDNQGDRYREMRNIKTHMANREFAKIPAEFRSMKRLWNLTDLIHRRDHEARLFEAGLGQNPAPPAPDDHLTHGIIWVQHSLNVLGALPPMQEDGIYGPVTKHFIEVFQTENGLAVTGTPDGLLIQAIEDHLARMSAPAVAAAPATIPATPPVAAPAPAPTPIAGPAPVPAPAAPPAAPAPVVPAAAPVAPPPPPQQQALFTRLDADVRDHLRKLFGVA